MLNCDPVTGVCLLPELADGVAGRTATPQTSQPVVRYIGDPMCSWCWGMAPVLEQLLDYCRSHQYGFGVHVGGLRPGGGDTWNAAFRSFLRNEWAHIHQVSGQTFGYTLLERSEFNYDTEPACRAVVSLQLLRAQETQETPTLLAFFAGIQKRFYVDGQDPGDSGFYRELCADFAVPYQEFLDIFLSEEARSATQREFQRCRRWGIRGFPSIILDRQGEITPIATGYASSSVLFEQIETVLATSSPRT